MKAYLAVLMWTFLAGAFVCALNAHPHIRGVGNRRLPSSTTPGVARKWGPNRSRRHFTLSRTVTAAFEGGSADEDDADTINLDDERLYAVELPASTGIQWGSDLSLRWVRVLGFEEGSPAPLQGVGVGHQLVAVEGESVVGSSLSGAVQCFGELRKAQGSEALVQVVFFKGSAEELQDCVSAAALAVGKDLGPLRLDRENGECVVTVTFAVGSEKLGVGVASNNNNSQENGVGGGNNPVVKDKKKSFLQGGGLGGLGGGGLGQPAASSSPSSGLSMSTPKTLVLTCKPGTNLRDLLVANGVNVYRSLSRWTNCSGKQLCGTCIVEVTEGLDRCSRRGLDEASTLRQNPQTYRLSCVTDVYGDVSVVVGGEVGAEQWTR